MAIVQLTVTIDTDKRLPCGRPLAHFDIGTCQITLADLGYLIGVAAGSIDRFNAKQVERLEQDRAIAQYAGGHSLGWSDSIEPQTEVAYSKELDKDKDDFDADTRRM